MSDFSSCVCFLGKSATKKNMDIFGHKRANIVVKIVVKKEAQERASSAHSSRWMKLL